MKYTLTDFTHKTKKAVSLGVVGICAALLLSCSKGVSSPTAIRQNLKKGPLPDEEVSGQVLNISILSTIDTVDPQISVYGSNFELIGCFMEGLYSMAPDGSSQMAIATDAQVSPDGLFRTYKLREDCYWSNGDPVTAHDFVYAWQRAVDPAVNSEYSFMMSDIAQIKNARACINGLMPPEMLGVRALDNYTFVVELLTPVSFFNELLYFSTFYPANKAFVESVGEKYGTSAEYSLSNGPFILKEYSPEGGDIRLIKNTAYYDARNIKLAGIHYVYCDSYDQAMEKYDSGDIDLVELKSSQVTKYIDHSDFRSVPTGFMYYMSPNVTKGAMQNKNLRRAINLAIDRDAIANSLGDGSRSSYTAVPAGYAFSSKGQDFSKPGVEFPEYADFNVPLAREYLKKAQAELGKKEIQIDILGVGDTIDKDSVLTKVVNQLNVNLPELKFNYSNVTSKEKRRVLARGDYELSYTNWGPDYADPMTYLSMWLTGNDQNSPQYSNSKFDSIIANCTNGELATKPDERWNALKDAEKIIMEDAVIMPLYIQCNGEMVKPNVKGIEFHAVAINRFFKNVSK